MAAQSLDCTNLNCPMPIVKIRKTINTMESGDILEVTANDPAFGADVRAWSAKTGNKLVRFEDGPVKTAIIEKS